MNLKPADLRKRVEFCLSLPGTAETFPFGKEAHVLRVDQKMFALIHWMNDKLYVSAKCEPEKGERLRAEYDFIIPAYHLNKTHWVSVTVTDNSHFDLEQAILLNSYELVFNKLTKKKTS